jgi:hypothetical protein
MTPRALLIAALLLGCSGCNLSSFCPGCDGVTIATPLESNYITFEHPFTDAAADEARIRAERICGQRKQIAFKTASACSLTRCTTHYQCADKPAATTATSQPENRKK